MASTLDIVGGILCGTATLFGLYLLTDAYGKVEAKKELKNFQTIKGVVVEENLYPDFMNEEYDISIRTFAGKRNVIHFSQWTSNSYGPRTLNTLFAPGDTVSLEVATNKDFDGNQRYVGLTGKLSNN